MVDFFDGCFCLSIFCDCPKSFIFVSREKHMMSRTISIVDRFLQKIGEPQEKCSIKSLLPNLPFNKQNLPVFGFLILSLMIEGCLKVISSSSTSVILRECVGICCGIEFIVENIIDGGIGGMVIKP